MFTQDLVDRKRWAYNYAMAKGNSKLPKLTLTYIERTSTWSLKQDKTGKTIKKFDDKQDATKRGILKKLLGKIGGSVKIQKMDGDFQEERTYPKSKDPKGSEG